MDETKKGFIQLHLSVLLAGFTGLFGRLITLNEVDIVWYRMLFYHLYFVGIHRATSYRMAEIPSTMRMRSVIGASLDSVLWKHKGIECIDRCHLLLIDRFLHGNLRTSFLQKAVLWSRITLFADYRCWCTLYLFARRTI